MKSAFNLSIVLLTFIGAVNSAAPDPQKLGVRIEAKFVDIPEVAKGPLAGAPLPAPLDVAKRVPGPVCTFTDPQFQAAIREISQRKGVDLLAFPGLTTRIGQRAKIEMTRELAYKDEAGMQAVKDIGIILEVLPKMTADDQFDIDLSPQIVEFKGFVNHKNGWDEPIFTERNAPVSVVMTSGQTIVLEMDPKTDKQIVQETDEAGHVISTKTVFHTKRTLVFVTAQLVDPVTGMPLVPKHAAAKP